MLSNPQKDLQALESIHQKLDGVTYQIIEESFDLCHLRDDAGNTDATLMFDLLGNIFTLGKVQSSVKDTRDKIEKIVVKGVPEK